MLTIYPPAGVLGFGRYRTAHRTIRPLAITTAMAIVDDLDRQGIYISARVRESGVAVDLSPSRPVTTRQEARAIGAFTAVTDARVMWRREVTP